MLTTAVVLFCACGALFTAFPFYYTWRTRHGRHWWQSRTGRWIFALNVVLALLVDLTLLTFFLGHEWPGLAVVRIVLYAAFAVLGVWQIAIMHSATRRP